MTHTPKRPMDLTTSFAGTFSKMLASAGTNGEHNPCSHCHAHAEILVIIYLGVVLNAFIKHP